MENGIENVSCRGCKHWFNDTLVTQEPCSSCKSYSNYELPSDKVSFFDCQEDRETVIRMKEISMEIQSLKQKEEK